MNIKQKIINSLENEEDRTFEFKIEIQGNSGACSINKNEEAFIQEEIIKLLEGQGMKKIKIGILC